MAKPLPLISVVFVTYNGKSLLAKALKSLKNSTFKSYEVLVVDNASTDGTSKFLIKQFPSIKIILNKENLGYTGINTALPHCRGKFILFLNNDLELHKNAMEEMLNALQKDRLAALAAPKLVNYYDRKVDSAGTWVSRSFYNGHFRAENVDDSIKEIPYMGIGLIRKEIVVKFGHLFDPDYFIYAEDLDLGLRIRMLGMKVLTVPKAICYHMHSQTMKNVPDAKKTFLLERNLLTTFYKDLSFQSIVCLLPYVYGMRVVAILKDLFSGNVSIAIARVKAMTIVLFNLPSIIKKRRHVQQLRTMPDSYVFRIFTEKHLFSSDKTNV